MISETVSDVRFTNCKVVMWNRLSSFSSLKSLYLNLEKAQLPEELSVLDSISTLQKLIIVIEYNEEANEIQHEIVVSSEEKDNLVVATELLPYEEYEITQFLDNGKRELQIILRQGS